MRKLPGVGGKPALFLGRLYEVDEQLPLGLWPMCHHSWRSEPDTLRDTFDPLSDPLNDPFPEEYRA